MRNKALLNLKASAKRAVVYGLLATTLVTTSAGALSIKSFAAESSFSQDQLNSKIDEKMAKALIIKAAGKVPVIGDLLGKGLDEALAGVLGTEPDKTLEALQDIQNKLAALNLKMDDQTSKLLSEFYQIKMDDFNKDINSVDTITKSKLIELSTYASESDNLQKAIDVSKLFDFSDSSTSGYVNVVRTLTKYVQGVGISNVSKDGIYDAGLRIKASESALFGHAAIKNSKYINDVNTLMTNAYKLIITVLEQKIYVGQYFHSEEELRAAYPFGGSEYEYIRDCMKKVNFHKGILDINSIKNSELDDAKAYDQENLINVEAANVNDSKEEGEGLLKEFHLSYDPNNSASVVSKYNAKVKDNWFSYIQKQKDNKLNYQLVKLNSVMQGVNLESDIGLNRSISRWSQEKMVKDANNNLRAKMSKSLSRDAALDIYNSLRAEARKGGLYEGKSFIEELDELGFDVSGIKANKEMLILDSRADGGEVDNSNEHYWWSYLQYNGVNGYDKDFFGNPQDVRIHDFKEHQGCYPKEKGNHELVNVFFFNQI